MSPALWTDIFSALLSAFSLQLPNRTHLPANILFFLVEIFLKSLLWILSSGQLNFDLLVTKSVSQISIQSSVANIFKTSMLIYNQYISFILWFFYLGI